MNDGNLIPNSLREPRELSAMGKKGGAVKSLKKKYAAKIRAMKQHGVKNKDVEWLLTRITEPEANILQIQSWIDELRDSIHPNQRVALINTAIALHKAQHGEKHQNTNLNINVNWADIIDNCKIADVEITKNPVSENKKAETGVKEEQE